MTNAEAGQNSPVQVIGVKGVLVEVVVDLFPHA